jgi:hypothetical protein
MADYTPRLFRHKSILVRLVADYEMVPSRWAWIRRQDGKIRNAP